MTEHVPGQMELPPDRCEGLTYQMPGGSYDGQLRNCGNAGIRWVDVVLREGMSLRRWMCQGPCEWVIAE